MPTCELCGNAEQPARVINGTEYRERGRLVWDHCHEHNIVRGTLCGRCNTEEAINARVGTWGDRFTEWRERCPLCPARGSG